MNNDHIYYVLTKDEKNDFKVLGNTTYLTREKAMIAALNAFYDFALREGYWTVFVEDCVSELYENNFVGVELDNGNSVMFMVAEV